MEVQALSTTPYLECLWQRFHRELLCETTNETLGCGYDEDSSTCYRSLKARSPTPLHYPLVYLRDLHIKLHTYRLSGR